MAGLAGLTAAAAGVPRWAWAGAPAAPTEFEPWAGASFGTFLRPKGAFWSDARTFDVVVHFNAAHMVEKEYRTLGNAGLRAVVTSEAFGHGSAAYHKAFADPARFNRDLAELGRRVSTTAKEPGLTARRVALVAWSAGYGAVAEILKAPAARERVDAVVLLDGLHDDLPVFTTFAKRAAAGEKLFVVTHTAIAPGGFASTGEAAQVLADGVGASREGCSEPTTTPKGLTFSSRIDTGDFHVRASSGGTADEHLEHLHLVEPVLSRWLLPRWTKPTA